MNAAPGDTGTLRNTRDEYDRSASAYDDRWADYLRASTRPLLALLDLSPGARLLDVGCGTGVLLDQIGRRWPEAQLCGIDPSGGMLRRARDRLPGSCRLIQGEATSLPFADHSFTTVVSTSSLRYWTDAPRSLREIARVLVPGGQLLLVDWSGDALRHRMLRRWLALTGRVGGHLYRRQELAQMLSVAGFSAEVESFAAGWYWRFLFARATLL